MKKHTRLVFKKTKEGSLETPEFLGKDSIYRAVLTPSTKEIKLYKNNEVVLTEFRNVGVSKLKADTKKLLIEHQVVFFDEVRKRK